MSSRQPIPPSSKHISYKRKKLVVKTSAVPQRTSPYCVLGDSLSTASTALAAIVAADIIAALASPSALTMNGAVCDTAGGSGNNNNKSGTDRNAGGGNKKDQPSNV
jgi:hypothetical protein